MKPADLLYFGAWGGPGHFLWNRGGGMLPEETTPWGKSIDSTLCPNAGKSDRQRGRDDFDDREAQIEGHAHLHHKGGWTALAFWDRSQDQRFGSNSAFLASGTYTAEEILAAARESYPTICARFTFQIQVQEGGR